MRGEQQGPPTAGERRSWRKLLGAVIHVGMVQTTVPKAGRKDEDSFCLLAAQIWTHALEEQK